jgi:hypothetical protein
LIGSQVAAVILTTYFKAFLSVGQKIMHKLVSLNHLGVYFETGNSKYASPIKYKDIQELNAKMEQMVCALPARLNNEGTIRNEPTGASLFVGAHIWFFKSSNRYREARF